MKTILLSIVMMLLSFNTYATDLMSLYYDINISKNEQQLSTTILQLKDKQIGTVESNMLSIHTSFDSNKPYCTTFIKENINKPCLTISLKPSTFPNNEIKTSIMINISESKYIHPKNSDKNEGYNVEPIGIASKNAIQRVTLINNEPFNFKIYGYSINITQRYLAK